jgi:hypothetical protein
MQFNDLGGKEKKHTSILVYTESKQEYFQSNLGGGGGGLPFRSNLPTISPLIYLWHH